jgi:hypothetical protein
MDTTKGTFTVDSKGFSVWSQNGAATSSSTGGSSASIDQPDAVQKYTGTMSRDDNVPKKPVAAMSCGGRVRIARLY